MPGAYGLFTGLVSRKEVAVMRDLLPFQPAISAHQTIYTFVPNRCLLIIGACCSLLLEKHVMLRSLELMSAAILFGIWPVLVGAQQDRYPSITESLLDEWGDKTYRFASGELNGAILYLGLDGSTFLWFPKKVKISAGTWSGGLKNRKTAVCVNFPYTVVRRLTETQFGERKCIHLDKFSAAIVEVANGDILNLKSKKFPCRICSKSTSISQLAIGLRD